MKVTHDMKSCFSALLIASGATMCFPLQMQAGNHVVAAPITATPVQTIVVKGYVHDTKGEPVIGAGIQVVGSKIATITDIDGKFSLTVPSGSSLLVSYIGFVTKEVKANANLDVTLSEDNHSLDEVVVVGYGNMKKRDLTGAISSVKGSEVALAGVASAAHALAGKAAGLYVRQNSAQPGGGLDILVRGAGSVNANNDPLYVVDGFPIAKIDQPQGVNDRMNPGTQGVLNFLNPNDIERVEVLKDASATAIYGARAANGVVIITTKRGAEGKPQVDYSYNYSFQKYSDNYDMLSLQEWMVEKNKSTWEYWVWENGVGPWERLSRLPLDRLKVAYLTLNLIPKRKLQQQEQAPIGWILSLETDKCKNITLV